MVAALKFRPGDRRSLTMCSSGLRDSKQVMMTTVGRNFRRKAVRGPDVLVVAMTRKRRNVPQF